MTIDHLRVVVHDYITKFNDSDIHQNQLTVTEYNNRQVDHVRRLEHCHWMCLEIWNRIEETDHGKLLTTQETQKLMRWLGFIQGVMAANGWYSISELRDHSRS